MFRFSAEPLTPPELIVIIVLLWTITLAAGLIGLHVDGVCHNSEMYLEFTDLVRFRGKERAGKLRDLKNSRTFFFPFRNLISMMACIKIRKVLNALFKGASFCVTSLALVAVNECRQKSRQIGPCH